MKHTVKRKAEFIRETKEQGFSEEQQNKIAKLRKLLTSKFNDDDLRTVKFKMIVKY